MAPLYFSQEAWEKWVSTSLDLPLSLIQIIVASSFVIRCIRLFVEIDSLQKFLLTTAIYAFYFTFNTILNRLLIAISKELTRDGPRTLDSFFVIERIGGMILCVVVFVGAYTPSSTYSGVGHFIISTTWGLLRSRVHGYLLLNEGSIFDFLQLLQPLVFRALPLFVRASFRLYHLTATLPERYKESVLLRKLRPRSQSENSQERFHYKRISLQRQIRLLRLQPCLFSFKATLVPTSLDTSPPFDAISYTWGEADRNHELIISGQPMRIPKSTADIIRQRASLWRYRMLWIDAVCIDQNDEDDKNQQVGMMRDIYNAATRTIVSLGDGPAGKILFEFLDELFLYENFYNPDEQVFKSPKLIKEESPKWLALKGLLNHSYWKRAWVVQEIVMAKSVHINYAGYWYDWSVIAPLICSLSGEKKGDLLQKMDIAEGMTVPNFQAISRIERINEIKNLHFTKEKLDLEEMVLQFVSTKSTLDQDRIFAFQGISKAADDKVLEPDYKLTSLEVFEKLAIHSLQSNNPFRVFSIAGIGHISDHDSFDENWPSWIANWTELSKRFPPGLLENYAPYRAAGDSHIELIFQKEDHSIRLAGIFLGRIRRVATEKPNFNVTEEDIEQVGELGNDMEQKILQIGQGLVRRQKEASRIAEEEVPGYFRDGQTRQEALWRTLLCNRSINSYPAEDSFGQDFQDYLRIMENVPRILSGDHRMALEGQLGITGASEDIRDEILRSEGYEDKATPEETIDTIQKVLEEIGVIVDARQYLNAELLTNRPRLTKELVKLAGISIQNAAVLVEMEEDPDSSRVELSLERKQAIEELYVYGFSTAYTPDLEQQLQKICLMYGWCFGIIGVKFSDEKISAMGFQAREQGKVMDVLHQEGFGRLLASTMALRQFAITNMDLMAMVPPETESDDVVCVFLGAKTPHILREVRGFAREQRYKLVGEAYIHGYMDGTVVTALKGRVQSFYLV